MTRKQRVVVSVVVLAVLASVLAVFGSGGVLLFPARSTVPTPQSPLFPAFTMTREITTETGTSV